MKRFFRFFGVFILVAALFPLPVYAVTKSDDTITLRADEVIDDDYFVAGDDITIEGTVNGDLYAAGSNIKVRGTINGDVLAIGQNIDITGVIRDDVRVAGGSISLIGAEVGDSVSAASNDLSIDGDTVVGGGLVFGGRNISIDGAIGRGVIGGAEDSRIDGPVGKTVKISATSITIDKDAVIQGDFEYSADSEAAIDGTILGQTIRNQSGPDIDTDGLLRWFVVGYKVWAFVAASIVGGVVLLLFPRIYKRADKRFRGNPGRTTGIGAIALLAVIPAIVLLVLSVFGIPLALISLALFLIAIYTAKLFVAFSAGSWALSMVRATNSNNKRSTYLALLVGLAAYYILSSLPIIGGIVSLATFIIGLGMMMSLYNRPSKQPKS